MSIPSRPADTTREADRTQVDLFRNASLVRRARIASSLSTTVIRAARRAITHAMPDATQRERDLRFVELHYGPEIAEGLRNDLVSRDAAGTR